MKIQYGPRNEHVRRELVSLNFHCVRHAFSPQEIVVLYTIANSIAVEDVVAYLVRCREALAHIRFSFVDEHGET